MSADSTFLRKFSVIRRVWEVRPGLFRRIFGTRQILRRRQRKRETERKREKGAEEGEIGDAGRENRVIYCKQYHRRHAEGVEEWEKPVSLVPEMYFIATEDVGALTQRRPCLPSFGSPLDLNKSMRTSWALYSPLTVSRSRCSLPDLCDSCE